MLNRRRFSNDVITINVIGYFFMIVFSAFCCFPFLLTLSGSLTQEKILSSGVSLFPKVFSTDAYRFILEDSSAMLRAYSVTFFVVIVGTLFSLFIVSCAAYVLQRKEFRYGNLFTFYFFFTTLFSGGLVPYYMLISDLGLRDNLMVLIIPGAINVFNLIIIKTYFKTSIPDSIAESAKIDGAGAFTIYLRLYLPIAKPVFATVGLFLSISYWNEWINAMLFISKTELFPLQYFLYRIYNSMNMAQMIAEKTGVAQREMPLESFRYAMTIFTIGPIIFVYPFIQKYFIAGMTIGAVKG